MNKLLINTFKLITLLAILSSLGCTSSSPPKDLQIVVPEGKAVIYFFRPSSASGAAIKFHVHTMDGKPVGYLGKSGDNFSIIVEPGRYQYWSRAASRNDVTLNVKAGKIYYVKGTVNMGFVVGRPVLEEVSASGVPK
jgi:hypothetical protein